MNSETGALGVTGFPHFCMGGERGGAAQKNKEKANGAKQRYYCYNISLRERGWQIGEVGIPTKLIYL